MAAVDQDRDEHRDARDHALDVRDGSPEHRVLPPAPHREILHRAVPRLGVVIQVARLYEGIEHLANPSAAMSSRAAPEASEPLTRTPPD